jgi:mannose-6-phosphate isomerase-like protein (cupin superfamily)
MLHIKDKADCTPIVSAHGEVVYELMGKAAGGTTQHSLAHIEMPAGKGSLPHHHPEAEESYYILQGQARLIVDGETYTLSTGQSVAITPGMVHQILNDQDEPLHFLAVCAPAWIPDNSVYRD